MRSKGRCESASAVRPAAFHASSQVGLELDWSRPSSAQSSRDSSPHQGAESAEVLKLKVLKVHVTQIILFNDPTSPPRMRVSEVGPPGGRPLPAQRLSARLPYPSPPY